MPHCIIEYAKNLEDSVQQKQLMDAVLKAAVSSELFEVDHIKLRTLAYDNFQRAYEKSDFIHVSLRILSGRTLEQRKNLSTLVVDELGRLGMKAVTITAEVIEMERGCYSKLTGR